MQIERTFKIESSQEPIRFSPVGGDLEKIGLTRDKVELLPSHGRHEKLTIGLLICDEEEEVTLPVLQDWCDKNHWRFATGFELADLHEQLFKKVFKKLRDEKVEDYSELSLLQQVVALGDNHKGCHVATSVPQWDWVLTFYAPKECLRSSFKFAVVKVASQET